MRFVILFPGRTGSSYLVSCLASHPEIVAEGERLVRQTAEWQRDWMRALYRDPKPAPVKTAGFKTKLKDVWDRGEFAALLAELDVRVITMARRNIVKLAVSTLNARRVHAATGRWNRTADSPELGPLESPATEIVGMVARCAAAQDEVLAFARTLALPSLALEYEEILADRDAFLARVTDFLGVSRHPLAGEFAKSTDDDLRRALADFDAVRAAFRGTPREVDFEA